MVADDVIAVLQAFHPPYVHADRSVELQGTAAGSDFRVAKHDSHFFTDLVDEHGSRPALGDDTGQLPQSLAHESGLQAHMGVPHIPFNFRFGHQSCYGVDDDDVDGTAADQGVADFQGLFAGIRLGNQQVVHVHAQMTGIFRIQGMLCIDEGSVAAPFLSFRNHVQGNRGLTGGFRPVDFNNPAPGNAPYAQCDIQGQRSRGNRLYIHLFTGVSQLHDGPLAEVLFNLFESCVQCFRLIHIHTHIVLSLYDFSCSYIIQTFVRVVNLLCLFF